MGIRGSFIIGQKGAPVSEHETAAAMAVYVTLLLSVSHDRSPYLPHQLVGAFLVVDQAECFIIINRAAKRFFGQFIADAEIIGFKISKTSRGSPVAQ